MEVGREGLWCTFSLCSLGGERCGIDLSFLSTLVPMRVAVHRKY